MNRTIWKGGPLHDDMPETVVATFYNVIMGEIPLIVETTNYGEIQDIGNTIQLKYDYYFNAKDPTQPNIGDELSPIIKVNNKYYYCKKISQQYHTIAFAATGDTGYITVNYVPNNETLRYNDSLNLNEPYVNFVKIYGTFINDDIDEIINAIHNIETQLGRNQTQFNISEDTMSSIHYNLKPNSKIIKELFVKIDEVLKSMSSSYIPIFSDNNENMLTGKLIENVRKTINVIEYSM